jgi:hypothetical protein
MTATRTHVGSLSSPDELEVSESTKESTLELVAAAGPLGRFVLGLLREGEYRNQQSVVAPRTSRQRL